MPERTRVVGVDWGSSRLRAWLIGPDGGPEASLTVDQGILFHRADDLRGTLAHHLADWLGRGVGHVVGAGMLGSRTGIVDAGYLAVPAGRDAWMSAAVPAGTLAGVPLVILPGVRQAGNEPDVMRGEEFQVFAALGSGEQDGVFVCPGTHSKWIHTRSGRIVGFRTYVTGELFAAWRTGSSLAGLLGDVEQRDGGFGDGLAIARRDSASTLAGLFQLRAAILTGGLEPEVALDALSGLLIGRELCHALAGRQRPGPVRVIGEDRLATRYVEALHRLGHKAQRVEIDTGRALAELGAATTGIGSR